MRSPIYQYIIDRVRKIRKDKKKTQQDVAIALGYKSNAYIGAIESMNPEREECYNNKQLNELAKFLDWFPTRLFSRNSNGNLRFRTNIQP